MKKYEFDLNKSKIFGIKSPIVWELEGSTCKPMVYFRKPKSVSQEDFDLFISKLSLNIKL